MRITIVTGMSGSGKTQVIRYFEDIGYFCIDNMPPLLIPKLMEMFSVIQGDKNNFALVVDVRAGETMNQVTQQVKKLKENGYDCDILFLNTNDETLVKRFKETRRTHPLNSANGLTDSIRRERIKLNELYHAADNIIDTSNMKIAELYGRLKKIYGGENGGKIFAVNVMAFGFKYGMPLDADLVFDVRCFPNPFYVEALKHKTGNDPDVQEYVMKSEQSRAFMEKLNDMMDFMLPMYIEEGKTSLTVAIGCTGGKHRSVTMANLLHQHLKEQGYNTNLYCRDLGKE